MKLKDLSSILWSPVGCFQDVIIYNITDDIEMEPSCRVEYTVKYSSPAILSILVSLILIFSPLHIPNDNRRK